MHILITKIVCVCLVIAFFTSCGSDYEEPIEENRVLGVWNNYHEDTDSLVMTRVFTKDFQSYFTFSEGKVQNEKNKQNYQISETHIILDAYTQTYVIKNDTLWITNSLKDQTTKYIRID